MLNGDKEQTMHLSWFTCEVFGQVRVVHETMTGKLHTLKSDRHMDVVKPSWGGEKVLMSGTFQDVTLTLLLR